MPNWKKLIVSGSDANLNSLDVTANNTIGGLLKVADGTAAAPSITFTNDTNTGIFKSASDALSITAGGNTKLTVNSTGINIVGTIDSGAITSLAKGGQFSSTGYYVNSTFKDSDSNSGVILGHNDTANGTGVIAGINKLAFLTYGSAWTQALLLDSSQNATFAGNVSIVATSAKNYRVTDGTQNIYVGSSGNTRFGLGAGASIIQSTGASFGIGTQDGNNLILGANNTAALTIDTSANSTFAGSVTIPSYILHAGNTGTAIGFDADNVIRLKTDSSTAFQIDPSQNIKVVAGSLSISGDNSNFATLTESGTGDFEIHAKDDLRLNADGHDIVLKGASNEFGRLTNSSQDFIIQNTTQDKDIILRGNDNGATINALTLDMSNGGNATFAGNIFVTRGGTNGITSSPHYETIVSSGISSTNLSTIQLGNTFGSDSGTQLRFQINNTSGNSTPINALLLDTTGATFAGDITLGANHIGRDADNYVGFETDNLIKFRVNGATQVKLADGVFAPQTDSDVDLGSSSTRFKDAFVDTITTTGNATFAGDINSTGLTVDYTGNRTGDAGILVTNDNDDWGVKVDKDGTTDYGILSQTDGDNAIVVRNAAGTTKVQLQGDGDATFAGVITYGNSTGVLTYGGDRAILRSASSKALELQTNGGTTLMTGIDANATFAGNVTLGTGDNLYLNGTTGLRIVHDGSNGNIINNTGDLKISNTATDKDIIFRGKDGASTIDALTLDMSDGGWATFNSGIHVPNTFSPSTFGKATFAGNVTVAGSLTAQEFHTEFVSASILYESGSTKFGDTADDIHSFTGSLKVLGNTQIGTLSSGLTGQLIVNQEGGVAPVAKFMTRTNKAIVQVSDNDTTGYISSENGLFSLGRHAGVNAANININASHNVGIGTSNPGYKLHNTGTSRLEGRVTLGGNVNNFIEGHGNGINFKVATDYSFTKGSDTIVTFKGSGNVGIGTAAPEAKLTVKGDPGNTNQPTKITNSSTDTHTGLFLNGTGNAVNEKYGLQFGGYNEYSIGGIFGVMDSTAASTSGDITFDLGNGTAAGALVERMRITHEGNVGIGETDPSAKLHVLNSTKTLVLEKSASGYFNAFGFNGNNPYMTYYASTGMILGYGESTGNSPTVTTMFLGKTGNVGIGTSSPSAMLDIRGGSSGDNDIDRFVRFKASNGEKRFDFYIGGTGNASRLSMFAADGTTEGARISTTGDSWLPSNLGIGTTTPNSKLDVRRSGNGVALELIQTSGNVNDYIDLKMIAGNTTAGTLGTILRHKRDGSGGGDFSILTNPTLTGTPTEKLTIKSGGNVGIGTTNPTRGDLVVEGDFKTNLSGNGQLAVIGGVSGSNASGSGNGGQMVFGGSISTSDSTRTFGSVGGHKENDTSGNRAGYLSFGTRQAASPDDIFERMRISSTGAIKLNSYGSGTYTGTLAKTLGVDSSGNVIEFSGGSGGGAISSVSSGADNRVAVFSGTDSLEGDANLTWDATTLGIQVPSGTTKGIFFKDSATNNYGTRLQYIEASNLFQIKQEENGAQTGIFTIKRGDGNVGIGTDNPTFQLSIENHQSTTSIATMELDGKRTNGADGPVGEMIFSNNGDTFATVAGYRDGADNKGSLQFQTQDGTFTTKMTVSSEGNVGIGTTNPTDKLNIVTGVGTFDFKDYNLTHSTSLGLRTESGYLGLVTEGADDVFLSTNGFANKRLTVKSDGKIGIGTTAPSTIFQVKSTGADDGFYLIKSDNTNLLGGIIQTGTGDGALILRNTSNANTVLLRGQGNNFINGGNLGIGNSSPGAKLDVKGDGAEFYIRSLDHSVARIIPRGQTGTNIDKGLLSLFDTGTEDVRIDTAGNSWFNGGNVGIGTGTPGYTLDVNGDIQNNGVLRRGGNVYIKSTGSNTSIGPAGAGTITFHTSSVVTSADEAMRIDANGNLLLNNTSAGARLDIREDSNYAIRAEDASGHYFRVNTGGNTEIRGNLTVGGIVTAQEFHTEFVSASVLYESGSSKFGDTQDDDHDFTGSLNVSGSVHLSDNSMLKLGNVGGGDMQLYHNGSHSIISNQTGDLYIRNQTDNGKVYFQADNGNGNDINYFYLDGERSDGTNFATRFPDQSIILLGSGNGWNDGSQLYHNGSNFYLNEYVGDMNFTVHTNDGDIIFKSDDGSGGVAEYFRLDGSAVNGSSVLGATRFPDKSKIYVGTGGDLEIFHNGSQTYIENYTGEFNITQHLNDGDMIFKSDDGSGGVAEYFRLDGGITMNVFSKPTWYGDGVKSFFGNSQDLQIYHDGSNSYIKDAGSGGLRIASDLFRVYKADLSGLMINAVPDDRVELYFNDNKKFETTSTGATIIGDLDADDVTIDGWGSVSASLSAVQTAGGVNGTGAANRVALWSDGDTLTSDGGLTYSSDTLYLEDADYTSMRINSDVNEHSSVQFMSSSVSVGRIGWHKQGYFGASAMSANPSPAMFVDAPNGFDFTHNNTGSLSIKSGSADVIIDSKVNVGIGTSSPSEKLQLKGDATYISVIASDGSNGAKLGTDSSGDGLLQLYSDAGVNNIKLYGEAASPSYINAGNLGIGTTNPAEKLHVNGDVRVDGNDGVATKKIRSSYFSSTQKLDLVAGSSADIILTSRNVGIGTTSPGATLPNLFSSTTPKVLQISSTATSTDSGVLIRRSDNATGIDIWNDGSNGLSYIDNRYGSSTGDLHFRVQTNGTPKTVMTVTGDEKIGIGTTSPGSKLQVGGLDDGSNYDITLGWNAVQTDAVGTKRSALTFKTGQTSVNNNDIYKWDIAMLAAPATVTGEEFGSDLAFLRSTRNSTATDATTMILTRTGNVGIGHTTLYQKFTVNGNIDIRGGDGCLLTFNNGDGGIGVHYNNTGTVGRDIAFKTYEAGVGNTEKMRITKDGNIGIGITSPSTLLDIRGAGSTSTPATSGTTTSTGTRFRIASSTNASAVLDFGIAASGKSWLQSTDRSDLSTKYPLLLNPNGGIVGIGTTSPVAKLHVYQNDTEVDTAAGVTIEQDGTGDAALSFLLTGVRRWRMGIDNSDSDKFKISDSTNLASSNKLTIDTSGNVGIGTSSPGQKLEVAGRVRATTDPTFEVYNSSANRGGIQWSTGISGVNIFAGGNGSANAVMTFQTNTAERMRINSSGNVGIGTTAPGKRLTLSESVSGETQQLLLVNRNDTNGDTSGILFGVLDNATYAKAGIFFERTDLQARGSLHFATDNSSDSGHATKSDARMTITTAGNVGIGVTNPDARLEIKGPTSDSNTYNLRLRSADDQELMYVRNDGIVSINHSYLYINNSAGMYSNGPIRARGGVSDDNGTLGLGGNGEINNLVLTSNTSAAFAGSVTVKNALIDNATIPDIDSTTTTIASVAKATYTAAFFDYVIKKGTNVRAGVVYACHNGSTGIEFTETSTVDLGDTSDVTLTVAVDSTNMLFKATTTSNDWSVKSLIRAL